MDNKIAGNPPPYNEPDKPDESDARRSLLDLRSLVVLVLAGLAGLLAYREGGWTAALTVGPGVALALHLLIRHRYTA